MALNPRSFVILSLVVAILLAVLPACAGSAPASPTAVAAQPAASSPAAPTAAAPAPAAPTTAAAAAPVATAVAPTNVTEYNVARLTDLSGPAAVQSKVFNAGATVALAYWNDTAGKDLGIKVNGKMYDTRFDASVTASLWPGVLASDKPVAIIATASVMVNALLERLSADKVSAFSGTGGTAGMWRANQWAFIPQPTFAHQTAGFLDWRLSTWKESRPIRLGIIGSQQQISGVDLVQGVENFLNKGMYAGKVDYSGVEWVSLSASDVSSEVKRLVDKKTDYVAIPLTTAVIVALKRALQQYKADATTKVQFFGSSPIDTHAQALPIKDFEGDYEVGSLATSVETDVEAYKIYQQYKDKANVGDTPWTATGMIGMLAALTPLRGIERAARAVGSDKVTGEAVYNAMFAGPLTTKDLIGISGDLNYTKESPFPIANLKMRIGTVKDGKFQLATPDWVPGPTIPKW